MLAQRRETMEILRTFDVAKCEAAVESDKQFVLNRITDMHGSLEEFNRR